MAKRTKNEIKYAITLDEDQKRAKESIWNDLQRIPAPELHYFLEHFVPSFSLSLDELNV